MIQMLNKAPKPDGVLYRIPQGTFASDWPTPTLSSDLPETRTYYNPGMGKKTH